MSQAPYQDLYIYEIQGDARPAAKGAGPGFLGIWLEETTSFVFFSQPSKDVVEEMLARDPGLKLLDSHYLTYEQWQGGMTLETLVMPGLVVAPAWEEPPQAQEGQKLLRLDPGLVFGNGLHPTTRHSLEFLLKIREQAPLEGVLDLGCGTGILALAAATLGANPVWAVDLNPLCVDTTKQNAGLNRLDLEVFEGPAQDFLHLDAPLILANIHWQVQQELWSDPARLEGKDNLILSGVTRSQVGPLEDLLAKAGYTVQGRREAQSTWFTLWLSRS